MSQVFGSRVEVYNVVDTLMVELVLHQFLDVCKVCHHAIFIERFGTTINSDDAVVPVQTLAFALISKV